MLVDPLEQFKIYPLVKMPSLLGHNIDFTNSSLYMFIAIALASLFLLGGIRKMALVPSYWQAFVEMVYDFTQEIIEGSAGKGGLRYTSIILTVFIFIFFCNLAGMLPLPLSFTVTSHIAVTLGLALFVFFFVTCISILKQGKGFFSLFLPEGTPLWLAPILIILELFSYLSRPLSLAIRLAANMIAGHTILAVIAESVATASLWIAPFSFVFVMLLILFEIFIAGLQAYVFTVLTCVYLSDAFNKH